MKSTTENYLIGILTGAAIVIILYFGIFPATPILSKSPITPDLKIEITAGIADTTYIYRSK